MKLISKLFRKIFEKNRRSSRECFYHTEKLGPEESKELEHQKARAFFHMGGL